MRRLWQWLLRPSAALSVWFLLVIGGVGGIIFWGGFNTAMEVTNSTEFCISCHEMRDNVYQEYITTVHYQNASGVRAGCADCHVPDPWVHKVVRKIFATRELYHHFVGTIDTPERFEAHRAEMAQRVWASMEASDSRECRNCHSFEAMDFSLQSADAAEQMQAAHISGEETCISCHKGIAHEMPDLSHGYRHAFREIEALAAAGPPADAETLYTIAPTPAYLSAEDAAEGGRGAGTLLAATGLEVLDRRRDALNVRLSGWQQDGADRVIYALMGQRIFEGAFRPEAIEAIERHETVVDPNTDLTWHRVSLDLWVLPEGLIEDRQMLWDYAAEMHVASCSTCHSLHHADEHLANQWIGVVDSMERFITLDTDQTRLLQRYLQMHARDVVEPAHDG
jgi:trimethylamine-N-oxide reductase cytochrome c-type subunit TorC